MAVLKRRVTDFVLVLGLVSLCTLALVHGQDPDGFAQDEPAAPNPLAAQVARLEQQSVDRDNEILHLRTELANCKATSESLDLTAQAAALVKRCEAAYGVTCVWDDQQRRVVKVAKEKP